MEIRWQPPLKTASWKHCWTTCTSGGTSTSGYKRASLTRRILKRMQAIDVDDYRRYMEVLEANPGEFAELFNTILINVTGLLRDRDAWAVLAETVIPRLAEAKTCARVVGGLCVRRGGVLPRGAAGRGVR
jgi:chemotaxis methyl-accepting protein methylase